MNTSAHQSVYVVIVSYQGMRWMERCLHSILASDYPVTCVVVDNASTDGTVEWIASHYPSVIVLAQQTNLGFGGANNIGMAYALDAGADYVFLLNQDAWIFPDTIGALLQAAQAYPNVGVISPIHLDYTGEQLEHYFTTIISPAECPNLVADFYQQSVRPIYPIQFIHAAAWFLSRACIEKTGGFDPVFFHYSEDIDWIQRTRYWGFEVGVTAHTRIAHFGTHAGLDSQRQYAFERNFALLALKDIRSKFLGRFLLFTKTSWDKFTTGILFGRWKDAMFHAKLFVEILSRLSEIRELRRNCRQPGAYLSIRRLKSTSSSLELH